MDNANLIDESIPRKNLVLIWTSTLFVAVLIISNITASKLYSIGSVAIPVGTSLFAITFLCTDVIAEVYGRKYSILVVFLGFLARVIALGFFAFAVSLEPVPYWDNQIAYESILIGPGTVILAGILTYPFSQLNDVFLFHYLKKKHVNKNLLWLRNITSTFVSQFLDSFIFVVIAFAATFTVDQILSIVIGQVIIKWTIAVLDTPFVYLIRNIALNRKWYDLRG